MITLTLFHHSPYGTSAVTPINSSTHTYTKLIEIAPQKAKEDLICHGLQKMEKSTASLGIKP
jgi:hypothetical protein